MHLCFNLKSKLYKALSKIIKSMLIKLKIWENEERIVFKKILNLNG